MNTEVDRAPVGVVPEMVRAGLDRCHRQWERVLAIKPSSAAEWADRAETLAGVCEREARWWTVLDRWTFLSQDEVPTVFGWAAMEAAGSARQRSRFWRDLATDWRARAAGRPVCGVIGCTCGGTCGVPA